MFRKTSFLVLCAFMAFSWSADESSSTKPSRRGDGSDLRRFKAEQRADEYANSLRRRDWLKDRLIFSLGLGSRHFAMGAGLPAFGAGVEYITKWHVAAFVNGGMIFKSTDPSFGFDRQGKPGYKAGLAYYFMPKLPVHLGIAVSYGTAYYDWKSEPPKVNGVYQDAEIYMADGVQGDFIISYMTNQWYYLSVAVGASYITDDKLGGSFGYDDDQNELSYVTTEEEGEYGIPRLNFVFGLSIGFALPDLFPDVTEKNRRLRDSRRRKEDR